MTSLNDTGRRPPSIRDVAAHAGVSHQTVSRVLNAHESIRPETRARVERSIAELGYRPNRAARILATSQTRTLGMLVSRRILQHMAQLLGPVETRAAEFGYSTIMLSVPDSRHDTIEQAFNRLLDQGVDGVIVHVPESSVETVMHDVGGDVAWVNRGYVTGADELREEQIIASRAMTRHLIDLGHTEFEYVAGPQAWADADARMVGFLAELSERGISARPPILGDWLADTGYRIGLELADRVDFTAVVAGNDSMAIGLMHAFRERGVRVPEDVSVVGFDDIPEAKHMWPPLTTMRQDFQGLGARAVDYVLRDEVMRRDGALSRVRPPELIVRSSSGPPRGPRGLGAVTRS